MSPNFCYKEGIEDLHVVCICIMAKILLEGEVSKVVNARHLSNLE